MHKAWCSIKRGALLFSKVIHQISRLHRLKNQCFGSNLSKITRPVAAIKSLRFALFYRLRWWHSNNVSNMDDVLMLLLRFPCNERNSYRDKTNRVYPRANTGCLPSHRGSTLCLIETRDGVIIFFYIIWILEIFYNPSESIMLTFRTGKYGWRKQYSNGVKEKHFSSSNVCNTIEWHKIILEKMCRFVQYLDTTSQQIWDVKGKLFCITGVIHQNNHCRRRMF